MRRAEQPDDDRAFLLLPLVAFDGRRHFVFVVDLDDLELVALDAALGINQGDVVVVAGADGHADIGGRRRCDRSGSPERLPCSAPRPCPPRRASPRQTPRRLPILATDFFTSSSLCCGRESHFFFGHSNYRPHGEPGRNRPQSRDRPGDATGPQRGTQRFTELTAPANERAGRDRIGRINSPIAIQAAPLADGADFLSNCAYPACGRQEHCAPVLPGPVSTASACGACSA